MSARRWWGTAVLAALALAGCESEEPRPGPREYRVALAEGTYRVAYGRGYDPVDEARFLAVTAQLDRAAGEITFTLSDGSHQTLRFTPRPESEWWADCATMKDYARDEVADLSPAPLVIETLTFTAPIVYAKCISEWMIVTGAHGGPDDPFLRLDLE